MGHESPLNDAPMDHPNVEGDPNAGHRTIDQALDSGSDDTLPGNSEQHDNIIIKINEQHDLNK